MITKLRQLCVTVHYENLLIVTQLIKYIPTFYGMRMCEDHPSPLSVTA
jgi:hypothetical protein